MSLISAAVTLGETVVGDNNKIKSAMNLPFLCLSNGCFEGEVQVSDRVESTLVTQEDKATIRQSVYYVSISL